MFKSRMLIAASFAAILAISSPSFAQTQSDPHHPQQGAATTQTQAMPGSQPQSGMMMPMGEMMQMMGQMMQMMGNSQMGMGGSQMGMGGGQMGMDIMGMSEKGTADHIDGRIAYARAELNITKDQEKAWSDFAAALHNAAEGLKTIGAHPMPSNSSADLPAKLELQEKLLTARLEGVRGIRAALTSLYTVLSEDQRKIANDLLVGPMGVMPMAMTQGGMMPAGMAQGGMMQGGMMPAQQ